MIRFAVLFASLLLPSAHAADWPIATDAAPVSWSVALEENIAWKITLPETGQNTPVVHQDRLFFSTMKPVDADAETGSDVVAWCCDAASGKVLWQRSIAGDYPMRMSGCFGDSTSPPAVCDGQRVVFVTASGAIACFDLDGKPIWEKKILSVSRTLPFLHDGKLVFTRQIYPPNPDGNFGHQYADAPVAMWTQLEALDMATGESVWTTRCGVNMGCAILPQRLQDGRAVAVVGRGGGHGPPEKPDGISLVDLRDGSTIWSLELTDFMATMSFRIREDEVHLFHRGEHLSVDALSGEVRRRTSILKDVPVRKWNDGNRRTVTESIPESSPRMITQTSNLLIGKYHYFRSYTRPYLGRVDVETGAVEYLELPLQLSRVPGKPEAFHWFVEPKNAKAPQLKDQAIAANEVRNARGFLVMGDKRSVGNGWGHIAAPTPSVAGPNLYIPVMNGTVYVIEWNAAKLDETALVAINDLGPAGKSYTRASLFFDRGRIYAHTIRELICIAKPVASPRLSQLPAEVHSVMQKHCFACHGESKQAADIRLDTLAVDFVEDRAAGEIWQDVLNVVSTGQMPPKKKARPSQEERAVLTGWIRGQLALAASQKKSSDIVMRRLNKDEYRYTLTDLLGVPANYGERLPADPLSVEGFANDGETLGMTALQLETYLDSARAAMADVLVEGPQPAPTATRLVQESATNIGIGKENISPGGRILDRSGVFAAIFGEEPAERELVPAEGRFTIRVKARAEFKPDQPPPMMRVVYGYKIPGAIPIYKELGTQTISDPREQIYEFSGLAHHFPYALHHSPVAVQIAAVENVLTDGQEKLPPLVATGPPNAKKKKTHHALDPDFPRIVVESVQLIGHDHAQWPPAAHRRILHAAGNEGTPEYARDVLQRFLSKAWRSPVRQADLEKYHRHFLQLSKEMSFVAAIRETLAVALTSPRFLYLVEPRRRSAAEERLSDEEIATRLSYFLWSSMPDDRLREVAAQGLLRQPDVLTAQVHRLLEDPKSERFIEQFTTQWLDLHGLERIAVNPQYYPRFKEELKADMAGETKAFFREILRSGTSALQFLDCDWTMINAPLARHYRLKGPKSQAFVRVSLAGTSRPGGLLGHASMHLINSNGEDSHPIKRAVWIRERLLDDPPLPPPPNVPALSAEDPNFAKLSTREQMERHRHDPACADCHRNIDAWGVALEHFDAVGLWRDRIRRPSGEKDDKGNPVFHELPVDAQDNLPDGVVFDGLDSLKSYLMSHRRDQFVRALVTKLLAFGLGRRVEWSDEETVRQLTERFAADGYRLPALIADIVTSDTFLKP